MKSLPTKACALVALLSVIGSCSDSADTGTAGAAGQPPGDDGRLRLAFEPLSQDTNFSLVTDMVFLPDPADELLVIDRDGGFAHMRLGTDGVETLMDFRFDDVWYNGGAGLLGVTVDPSFSRNHYIYIALSLAIDHNAIRRYTLHPGDPAATLASSVVIFDLVAPAEAKRWHNIASIGFDEAGVMWALIGEKGLFDPAQDPTSPLGSLIRIVPSRDPLAGGYTIPESSTPFSDDADPAVYTKGLRSPWKGRYHKGKWLFGDVGQDLIEEINLIDGPHLNFGWPIAEGPCAGDCAGMTDPWVHYDRSSSHPFVRDDWDAVPATQRSVYVGWIYEPGANDRYDGRWNDVATFGDVFVGFVRAKRLDGYGGDWAVGHLPYGTDWAQGPDGYVYVWALGGWPPPEQGALPPSPFYRAVLAKP
jgi:glucose/arabinose dehydrogenase